MSAEESLPPIEDIGPVPCNAGQVPSAVLPIVATPGHILAKLANVPPLLLYQLNALHQFIYISLLQNVLAVSPGPATGHFVAVQLAGTQLCTYGLRFFTECPYISDFNGGGAIFVKAGNITIFTRVTPCYLCHGNSMYVISNIRIFYLIITISLTYVLWLGKVIYTDPAAILASMICFITNKFIPTIVCASFPFSDQRRIYTPQVCAVVLQWGLATGQSAS